MTNNRDSLFSGIDTVAVLLYVALVTIGFLSITSATIEEGVSANLFSFSHQYIKQLMWVGVSVVGAIVLLLIDHGYFHRYANPVYIFGLGLLVITLLFGREVNGAKAWFEFGSLRVQPAEFVKIFTALALARAMSDYSFSIERFDNLFRVGAIICTPLFIIILQNDTGSGIVLGSFLFVLYREGLNKWLCIPILLIAMLFIFSFLLSELTMMFLLVLVCVVSGVLMNGLWREGVIFLASLLLGSITVWSLFNVVFGVEMSYFVAMIISSVLGALIVGAYALRVRAAGIITMVGIFLASMIFLPTTNYIFYSILRDHQRDRILSYLGIINDPYGIDYNVNQSKIAIGSGGFFGKGFLEGTQIKYGFVPEQQTDFIFCTVGEEWGFLGALVMLTLMCGLIFRLMKMGERQEEPFGRVYCYCAASILLFHTFVNVGMTVGLMPVMGIPLPFISYGGSSLLAFTILLFIAIRLDMGSKSLGGGQNW